MKRTTIVPTVLVTLVWIGCWGEAVRAASAGTAFTYQGRLIDAESAADGIYDLTFSLYDAEVAGSKVGDDVKVADVDVIDGYFTLELDFGSGVFDGDARWLEIGIRPSELQDPDEYTILLPRQELTPTPYALHSRGIFVDDAGNVGIGTTSPAEKLEVLGNVKLSGAGNGVVFPDGSKQTTAASGGGPESDYGRSGVAATLYEGTTPLADKYVNKSGDAMNGSSTEALLSVTNNDAGNCKAVYGRAASSGGGVTNYGGYFLARGGEGVGVGVYGEATGGNACGVFGHAPSAAGLYTAGVYGRAVGTYGYGVQGQATSDAGAGVFGQCGGGKGVLGVSTYGDGVYGESQSYAGEHAAVRGVNIGTGGYGVYGRSDLGIAVRAYGGAYDFYAAGPGWNYGPFTGAHEVILSDDFPADVEAGMIVSVTGRAQVRHNEDDTASISSTLPTVKLSHTANDKAVFGVLMKEAPLPQDHWYQAKQAERFAAVNALGEGRVWVCDISGPVEAGDYITTSPIPGYGQLQDDDLLHSYTLGKAIETVDSDSVTETIEFDGKTYKAYLIAVVYTSG